MRVKQTDYCVATFSLSLCNLQGEFEYSQHFVPLAHPLFSGLSVLASVALKCLPGGPRLKRRGAITMLRTPENCFFSLLPSDDPLSRESHDALYGAGDMCGACSGVFLGKLQSPLCLLKASGCANAPGQPALYNGVVGDPPDTKPAVEGHESHNHVAPRCLSGVGDEIVFPTPTTLRGFFS